MRVPLRGRAPLTAGQLRLVIAMTVAAVMVQTLGASFNYVLEDMLRSLGATDAQSDMARQMPTVGALLVIFVAGAVGQRLGSRRVLTACCALYVLGSAIVALAGSMPVATAGLLVANIGKSALLVVALASLSAGIRTTEGRATAFAAFSAAIPFAYLCVPVIAGLIVESAGWRWVTVVWIVGGCLAMVLVRVLVAPDPTGPTSTGELLTPGLAGLVLATAVEAITLWSEKGITTQVLVTLVLCAATVATLVIVYRRVRSPSLDLTPLRNGGLVLLLVVLVLTLFPNLFFYMTMALQYIYDLSPVVVAFVMAPAQLAAVLGAALSGRMLRRWGITTTGSTLMVVVAVALASSAVLRLNSPLWLAVAIMSVYAAAAAGAGVAVTNAVMNTAAKGRDGQASAFRGAAANLGTAIGVAGMTSIVIAAASASLQHQAVRAGIDPSTATAVARTIAQGATSEDASSEYAVPIADVTQIDDERRQAYLAGFRAHGLVGGAVTLSAAAVFMAARRRQERTSATRRDEQGAEA